MRLLLAALFFVQAVIYGQGQATSLLVHTDLECRWSVDGQPQGVLQPGTQVRLNLSVGEHHIEAVPTAGGPRFEDTVKLDETDGHLLAIQLQAAVSRAGVQSRGYWIDPTSKLTWAASDNGSGVAWSRAYYYCQHLTAGTFSDWTLPSIDELQGLFGGSANQSGFHVIGPIKLTGWAWSSSPGKEHGEQWALDFGDGARASVVTGDSGLNRALCVRRPANNK